MYSILLSWKYLDVVEGDITVSWGRVDVLVERIITVLVEVVSFGVIVNDGVDVWIWRIGMVTVAAFVVVGTGLTDFEVLLV
jgi:hypothetical protein